MSNSQTTVVWAGLVIKDGFIEKFKEAVEPVVKASREEVGCLKYDFLQDVYNPNTFYFFEEYKDETAFQEHRAMPYMLDFRPKREECVEKYLGVRVMTETYSR
jgi:quinol monooxygenase YgiN